MLHARSALCNQHLRQRNPRPLHVGGLMRRRVSCSASAVTDGQTLRGHGKHGWKDSGWDFKVLEPKLRETLVHYGQLAQATYDHLGLDPGKPTWGYTTVPAHQLIDYLTQDYPLAPGVTIKKGTTAPGTNEIYQLPTSANLSPIIYACAGAGDSAEAEAKVTSDISFNRVVDNFINSLFTKVASVPTTMIGGSRQLFQPDPLTGRELRNRSAFMGYVAVSQPTDAKAGVDVVFAWRGTIFKEEWAANFGQDTLKKCTWEPLDSNAKVDHNVTAPPEDVCVHAGFQDIYLRRAVQPIPGSEAIPADLPAVVSQQDLAPAEVVRKWMAELMRTHNVTTITTTGHSLGGALGTVAAFDIARELDALWANNEARAGWVTKDKPKVSAILFGSPRVGNWTFVRKFSDDLKIKALRICNIKDVVPKVPGIWVQILTSFFHELGVNVYYDMDSFWSKLFGGIYFAVSRLSFKLFESLKLPVPGRWGFFHVGSILEVDSDKDLDGVGKMSNIGQYHNLEVYLYLLSKKGRKETEKTDRNPLLLNKSDDILAEKDNFPADWWAYQADRHILRDGQSRWITDPGKWPIRKA